MEFVKLVGPAGVFFIMFALGLNLSIKKFLKVLKNYKALLTGLICQIIILPIIGLIAISTIELTPEFQFGIFLLVIMPSAAMSNYATKLVDANVTLSITLTSTCALLSFITVPLYLNLFSKFVYSNIFEVNLFIFSIKTFLFITIPVFLGIFFRQKFPKFFEKRILILDKFAFGIFLLIVFIAILIERNNLLNYFDDIGVVVIILISSIFIIVFIITKIFINDLGSRRAILIEGLLQNGAMGFVVGSLIYSEVVYLIPIAIYSLLQYCALMFYIGNIKIKN